MRLTTVIFIASLLQVSASTFGQRITINQPNTLLKSILKEIRKQSGFDIYYENNIISNSQKVSVAISNATVEEALNSVFKGLNLKYEIEGKTISIKKSAPSFLDQLVDRFRQIEVRGLVTDENDKPLPGVTIRIKGQRSVATSTNNQGVFYIKVPDNSAILEFSFIGYAKQEITVGDKTSFTLKLKEEYGALKEVMVVGYGTQNKSTIISSVAAVSGSEILKSPASNITQSLAGRLPGLVAFNPSGGRPGADDATLLIRGLSTIGDNSPLIVIDGIVRSNFTNNTALRGLIGNPFNTTDPSTGINSAVNPNSSLHSVNPLSYLDPSDIESISILKDASATAVYGARAANGVILVTTKRGTEGVTSITYSGNAGLQKAAFAVKPLDSYTTARLGNQAWTNEGTFSPSANGANGYTEAALAAIQNGSDPNRYANTDWYKAVYGDNSTQQSHNLSVNGGTSKTRYFASAGYLDQKGFYSASGLKRYNLRANLDGKVANAVDFSINIAGRKEDIRDTPNDPNSAALITPSIEPVQYTDGTYHYNPGNVGNGVLMGNGTIGYYNTGHSNFESSASLSYKIPFVPGLSVKGLFSYDTYNILNKRFFTPYAAYTLNDDNSFSIPVSLSSAKASLTEVYDQYQTTTSEASLNYDRTFGGHHVNALLLYTETRNQGQNISASRINFPSAVLDQLNLGSPTGLNNGGTALQNARRGIVSRLAYDYKGKYLVEFDSRYDGSDLFPPGQQYGFFPAVSAGWRLSEESFIKDKLTFITNLKIRGSWGQAGNDRAGAFQYLSTYSIPTSGGYSFGGANAAAGQILQPGVIANPVFTWERATTTNFGIDANLWNNLVGITADYFYKRTSNVLASNSTAIPAIIGGTLPVGNYAIMDNKGFEIELSHQNTIGNVSYYVRPNVTFNRSKIISFPDARGISEALKLTGKPIGPDALTGYLTNGLYQSQSEVTAGPIPLVANTKPGDIKYVDTDGDGIITPNDRVIISRGSTPGVMFGLNLGATYKGFDFSALIQGAGDVKLYIPNFESIPFYATEQILYPIALDYWTPDNPGARFPRLTTTSTNNQETSTFWLRDGAYARLKNVEIGYTLPKQWLSKLSVSKVRLFINGSNLFTVSHVKNIVDPESSLLSYPLVKVFNAGLSVKFN